MSPADDIAAAPLSQLRTLRVSWPLLVGIAGFLLPVALRWGLADPDIYWHITAGRWMVEHGHVATHDPFSFTMHGAVWIAHEWAAELLMAGCYLLAGWSGLVLLGAVCFGATLAYLMRFLLARMEPLHALLLTCLAACMMFRSLLDEPQALVWPLTAVWVGTLVDSSEGDRAPPRWLLPLMLAWANMHGSFMLGLLLAVALAVEAATVANRGWRQTAGRWTFFVLAALGCALINPRGYGLLIFPFHLLEMKSALHLLSQWQPPDFQQPQVLGVWLLLILGLAFAGRIRLSLIRSVLVLGLLYGALQHVRDVALLGMISPLLLAKPVATLWKRQPLPGRDADLIDGWFRALAVRASLPGVCAAIIAAGGAAIAMLNAAQPHPPESLTPRAAVDALLSQGPPGRIFNDFNFGGYLIFRGIPVFIDARADMYGDAFTSQAIEALLLAPQGQLETLLAQYKIDSILLIPIRPAVRLLDRLPGWKRLYADGVAVVYVRRKKASGTIAGN